MRPAALFLAVMLMFVISTQAPGADVAPYDPAALRVDRLLWSLPLGELSQGAGIVWSRAEGEDLFVLDSSHMLHCIDMNQGTHKWVLMLDRAPTYHPTIGAETVGVCVKDRLVLARRTNGSRLFDQTIEVAPCTPPAPSREVVYVGSLYKNRIVAVDPETGLTGWTFRFGGVISAAPKIYGTGSERFLYVVTQDGAVACLAPKPAHEGGPTKPEWSAKTGDRNVADPVLDAELLLVASEDFSLYAYNRFSGAVKWRFFAGVPLREAPYVAGDKVFLKTPAKLYCIDRNSGKELWATEDFEQFIGVGGGAAYLWSGAGEVGVFDAASGKILRKLDPTEAVGVIPNSASGILLFSDGSLIYAYK